MMRRTFLQQSGLALLTLLASQTGILRLGKERSLAAPLDKYIEALADPTNRKLALLVGINQYSRNLQLTGCVTDVKLQQELLVNRFGFQPSDVITLTDRQATRENIETAFIEHLSQQARADDVVVFHYSGYGMGVNIPDTIAADLKMAYQKEEGNANFMNGLVTTNGISLAKNTLALDGMLEETLALLANSLATDKLTLVLDTSYKISDRPLIGALRSRSLPVISQQPSPEELSFQQELKEKYPNAINKPIPGIILQAAAGDRIATETVWGGFSAGLFTYALTQYLWQVTPASKVTVSLARTADTIAGLASRSQEPIAVSQAKQPLFTYYSAPVALAGAEGFIKSIDDGDTVSVDLGGLPAQVLGSYGVGSCLKILPNTPTNPANEGDETPEPIWLQIRSREGLSAKAKLLSSASDGLEVGQLLQESIRILPRNLGTIVALDADLERIERVDATSAFANITPVSTVVIAGEQAADCLFGRVRQDSNSATKSESSPETADPASAETADPSQSLGGYGVFTLGGVLIPNTVGAATEAVKSAVRRLSPQFTTVLAAKLWGLTVNQGSSTLGVGVTLAQLEPENKILLKQETLRFARNSRSQATLDLSKSNDRDSVITIANGSKIQYRIENYTDRPIYSVILGLDSDSSPIAFYSPESKGDSSRLKSILIPPQDTTIVPQPSASINWIVNGSGGIAQIYVICSLAPFDRTLDALLAQQHPKGDKERVLDLPNPLEVAKALLSDLDAASAVSDSFINSTTDVWAMDVNAWANFSFVYRVV